MKSLLSIELSEAEQAVAAIRTELLRRGKAAAVAVADHQGEVLLLIRLGGVRPQPGVIACNKAWTAARQGQPTRVIGERVRSTGQDMIDIGFFGDSRYVGWAGGVPVLVQGQCVGSIAVSGLHEDEDEELAMIGLSALSLG